MELIQISSSKLKITLTEEEVKKYDIEAPELSSCAVGTRGLGLRAGLRPVLENARKKCGFDVSGGKVLVQLFPSGTGGCELFVTKLNERAGGNARRKCETENAEACVYSFAGIRELVWASAILTAGGYAGRSRAYMDENDGCLLFLNHEENDVSTPFDAGTLLEEFGARREWKTMETYIAEHGRLLCGRDAVFLLARML